MADAQVRARRRSPLVARLVRKAQRIGDPLISRLELRASGLELQSMVPHEQRLVLVRHANALGSPGTVVYDIGAATGKYTSAFANVSSIAHVIAFEPLSESYVELVRRTRDRPTVLCLQVALGDENGRFELRRSTWRDTSSLLPVTDTVREEFPAAARIEGVESVRVARLDDLIAEHQLPLPDVIKVDVQGFEDRVIRGGPSALRAARLCIVEVSFRPLYDGSPLFDDINALMRELGFQLSGFGDPLKSSVGVPLQADAVFERAYALDTAG